MFSPLYELRILPETDSGPNYGLHTPISKTVVGKNGEWQLSNGNCTTERNCGFYIWYAKTMCSSRGPKLGSTTTATNPPQMCIFDNEKQYFCLLCTCIFHLLTFWRRSRSFYDVKYPFAVVWTTWAYDDECSILSCPKRWFQFNSRIVKAHFSGIMTLNNWKMIAETRSDIFRWRSRFLRRRVCLSFLLILPYERPTVPGLNMTNHMTRHRRSALYVADIMGPYFLLIFNTHISFQSCNRRSTIDIRRCPRQHFLK